MTSRYKVQLCSAVAGSVLAAFATPAIAQDADGGRQLDTITVTATLRAENVQDVPVTLTVLDGGTLEKADIHDATGIALNTPGLSYGEFSPGQAIFAMRGVGSADDGAGLDNSVALFLDGVYIGRGAGVNFDVFDLDRIEVLKGPQGALFGRNTIGGAISVVTQRPSDEFIAKGSLTAGNEGIFRAQGLISGPLTDQLSGKLVVYHRQHDGFVRNVLLDKDVNGENTTSGRGQLRFQTDRMDWLLSADYMEDDREDAGRFPFVNGNFDYRGVLEQLGATDAQTTAAPIEGFTNREAGGVSLQGDIQFGPGTLTTITAFRNVETDWEMPSIGAPAGGGFDLDAGVFGVDVQDDIMEDIDTLSQELRWTSELGGNIDFVTGLYYFTEDTDRVEQFRLDRNTVETGQVIIGNEYTRTQNETTSYAVYGQANWQFTDRWNATIGGRYTRDEKDYIATAVNCGQDEATRAAAGFPNFEPCEGVGGSLAIIAETFRAPVSDDWSDFSPMGSIQYRPNDNLMLFGTVSTGYKSGGFAGSQGVEAAATTPVDPEDVTNFEAGFKGDFLDNTFRLNATAFFMDYKDLQIVRFGPVVGSEFGTFITTNIGEANIAGLEVDWDWRATERFTFRGNYAYLDTEVQDLIIPTLGGDVDVSGKRLRQAPRGSYNLIGDYLLPLGGNMGELNFNVQYSHVDEQTFDYVVDDTIAEEKNLWDARAAWTSQDGDLELALWGKNLTDEGYVAHSYVIGPGVIGIWGAPRTYGVTVTATF